MGEGFVSVVCEHFFGLVAYLKIFPKYIYDTFVKHKHMYTVCTVFFSRKLSSLALIFFQVDLGGIAKPGKYTWMALLTRFESIKVSSLMFLYSSAFFEEKESRWHTTGYCCASLLNQRWVISAAHCTLVRYSRVLGHKKKCPYFDSQCRAMTLNSCWHLGPLCQRLAWPNFGKWKAIQSVLCLSSFALCFWCEKIPTKARRGQAARRASWWLILGGSQATWTLQLIGKQIKGM